MSSSMNNFMEAYRAVHNKEAKEEFYANRDFITEMNLSPLFDTDLVDITEQVVAKLFETLTVSETKSLVEKAFADTREVQSHKVSRLIEAFKKVFGKVDEVAATVARESFVQYLDRKRLERNKSVMNSVDESHARIHRHKNAGEIENVKNLLISMLEEKCKPCDEKEDKKDKKKMSKEKHKEEAKKGKRWQDSDGDGKWYEKGEDVSEGAMGKAGSHASDVTVGRTQGKSEGGGWTGTPQRGLGRNYKGDKDKAKKKADAQYKADRRAAAKERSERGEDRVSKAIKSVQNESLFSESEIERINKIVDTWE